MFYDIHSRASDITRWKMAKRPGPPYLVPRHRRSSADGSAIRLIKSLVAGGLL